jgi:DNA-binding transcriptional MerR regulator
MSHNKSRPAKRPAKPSTTATTRPAPPERGLKIGEAARVVGVEPYTLRFWETQFACLKPKHARSKHRFYQPRDIDTLKLIRRLLHHEGFTIAGANKYIRENGIDPSKIKASAGVRPAPPPVIDGHVKQALAEVRRDLQSIHKLLQK